MPILPHDSSIGLQVEGKLKNKMSPLFLPYSLEISGPFGFIEHIYICICVYMCVYTFLKYTYTHTYTLICVYARVNVCCSPGVYKSLRKLEGVLDLLELGIRNGCELLCVL